MHVSTKWEIYAPTFLDSELYLNSYLENKNFKLVSYSYQGGKFRNIIDIAKSKNTSSYINKMHIEQTVESQKGLKFFSQLQEKEFRPHTYILYLSLV